MTSWEITQSDGKKATVIAEQMFVDADKLRFVTEQETVAVFYGAKAAYDPDVVGFHRGLPFEAMIQP